MFSGDTLKQYSLTQLLSNEVLSTKFLSLGLNTLFNQTIVRSYNQSLHTLGLQFQYARLYSRFHTPWFTSLFNSPPSISHCSLQFALYQFHSQFHNLLLFLTFKIYHLHSQIVQFSAHIASSSLPRTHLFSQSQPQSIATITSSCNPNKSIV